MAYKARLFRVVYRQAGTGLIKAHYTAGGYDAVRYSNALTGQGHKVLYMAQVGAL